MRALVFVLIAACSGGDEVAPPGREPGPARPKAPQVAAPSRGFVGVITAPDVVDVAPRFDGVVAAVHVRSGDMVTPGQVLVEMDPRPMREYVRAAEAALAAAQAGRREAEVEVEDARRRVVLETKAVTDGVSPKSNLEQAQFAVKRTEAAAQRAASTVTAESSRVQTARHHLSDMSLRAKTEGVVAMRFKDPGATVIAGAPIVRVIGQREPRLRFAVPPDQASKLAPGAAVTATIDTIASPISAIVRQVSPALDPASGMIIVEAELAPGAETTGLRPGLPARVQP